LLTNTSFGYYKIQVTNVQKKTLCNSITINTKNSPAAMVKLQPSTSQNSSWTR